MEDKRPAPGCFHYGWSLSHCRGWPGKYKQVMIIIPVIAINCIIFVAAVVLFNWYQLFSYFGSVDKTTDSQPSGPRFESAGGGRALYIIV